MQTFRAPALVSLLFFASSCNSQTTDAGAPADTGPHDEAAASDTTPSETDEAGETTAPPEVFDPGIVSASSHGNAEHEPHVAARGGRVAIAWIERTPSGYTIGYRI